MATNNMAMILLAGGAAIIGATFFLKPKDEKPPPPGERTGLTVAQILAAEAGQVGSGGNGGNGIKPTRPTVEQHKTAPKGLPHGWEGAARGGDPTQEGGDTEYIYIQDMPEILAVKNPNLPRFNAVVALNY